jgi:hypothetical protein
MKIVISRYDPKITPYQFDFCQGMVKLKNSEQHEQMGRWDLRIDPKALVEIESEIVPVLILLHSNWIKHQS